ncbi:hypothetical protein E4G67_01440 [Candidatus Bathyarchaeota archaeon]|nr:MAG: hypothetical protein E4G67_01440 [Candidatus Bathyarchaeota archaeon]
MASSKPAIIEVRPASIAFSKLVDNISVVSSRTIFVELGKGFQNLNKETTQKLRDVADQIDAILCYSEPTVTVNRRVINEHSNLAELLLK